MSAHARRRVAAAAACRGVDATASAVPPPSPPPPGRVGQAHLEELPSAHVVPLPRLEDRPRRAHLPLRPQRNGAFKEGPRRRGVSRPLLQQPPRLAHVRIVGGEAEATGKQVPRHVIVATPVLQHRPRLQQVHIVGALGEAFGKQPPRRGRHVGTAAIDAGATGRGAGAGGAGGTVRGGGRPRQRPATPVGRSGRRNSRVGALPRNSPVGRRRLGVATRRVDHPPPVSTDPGRPAASPATRASSRASASHECASPRSKRRHSTSSVRASASDPARSYPRARS